MKVRQPRRMDLFERIGAALTDGHDLLADGQDVAGFQIGHRVLADDGDDVIAAGHQVREQRIAGEAAGGRVDIELLARIGLAELVTCSGGGGCRIGS